MEKTVIGIVGLGYWGSNLIRDFSKLAACEVRYGCDLSAPARERYAFEYPRTTFVESYDMLLNDHDLNAVIIATPLASHHELAMRALRAGKHVLIEKPMASSVAQAQEIVDLAREKNLLCMVDHTFIYTGAVRKIKEFIDAGNLGKAYYFDSERINLGLVQEDHNVIWDLAPHDISILLHLFPDARPVSVTATGASFLGNKTEEMGNITVQFDTGLMAYIKVSWLSPVKIRKTIIGGSEKMVVYDDIEPSEKVKIYDKGVSVDYGPVTPFRPLYRSGDVFIPKLDTAWALEKEAEHVLACLRGEEKPRVPGEDGVRVVQILEMCDSSLRNNKREML